MFQFHFFNSGGDSIIIFNLLHDFLLISLWEIFQYSLRGQSNRDKIAKNLIYSFEKPKKDYVL